jgi:hypothetical protein
VRVNQNGVGLTSCYCDGRGERRRGHRRAALTKGISQSLYYSWGKQFLEAGKARLADNTNWEATSAEVKDMKRWKFDPGGHVFGSGRRDEIQKRGD